LRRKSNPPLSQKELGYKLKLSAAYISQIESGKRGFTEETARKIAEELHLNPAAERAFLAEAGFTLAPTRETLEETLSVIMADDPDNLILRDFVRADLLLAIHSWRRLVQAQTDLRTGGVEEFSTRFEHMAEQRAVSPLVRLYARRKVGEVARLARDLERADEQLVAALDSEDLLALNEVSPYHGALSRAVLLAQRGEVALQQGKYRKALDLFLDCEHAYRSLPGAPAELSDRLSVRPEQPESLAGAEFDPTNPTQPIPALAPPSDDLQTIWLQGWGQTLRRKADALMYLGHTVTARDACAEAARYLEMAHNTPQAQRMLRRVRELEAWALARSGQYVEAAKAHRAAREEARQAHDVDAEMLNGLYVSDDLLHQVEYVIETTAEDAYHGQAASILRPREAWSFALERDRDAKAWLDEAAAALRAVRRFQTSVERQTRPNAHSVSHCLRGLATVARFERKYIEAADLLQRAESHERAGREARRMLFIYEERGNLYWDQGSLDLARSQYALALEEAERDLASLLESQPESLNTGDRSDRVETVLETHKARIQSKIARLDGASRPLAIMPPDPRSARQALTALCQLAVQVIRGSGQKPTASDIDSSQSLDVWLRELQNFERQLGTRALAQQELSLSLSLALPDDMRELRERAGATQELEHDPRRRSRGMRSREQLFTDRRAAFLASVEENHQRPLAPDGPRNLDICSQPWMSRHSSNEAVFARAREAVRLARERPRGYAIAAAPFELPFGFGVKGDYVLIEAPETFLLATGLPEAGQADAGSRRERRAGYRFHDSQIAKAFRDHFNTLYESALQEMDASATLSWLGDIAEHGERKRLSGL
jgi:transcriptional regulator with XRE-family HTH domain